MDPKEKCNHNDFDQNNLSYLYFVIYAIRGRFYNIEKIDLSRYRFLNLMCCRCRTKVNAVQIRYNDKSKHMFIMEVDAPTKSTLDDFPELSLKNHTIPMSDIDLEKQVKAKIFELDLFKAHLYTKSIIRKAICSCADIRFNVHSCIAILMRNCLVRNRIDPTILEKAFFETFPCHHCGRESDFRMLLVYVDGAYDLKLEKTVTLRTRTPKEIKPKIVSHCSNYAHLVKDEDYETVKSFLRGLNYYIGDYVQAVAMQPSPLKINPNFIFIEEATGN
jgi:hypothetical protein